MLNDPFVLHRDMRDRFLDTAKVWGKKKVVETNPHHLQVIN